jgi:hypothetical protein
MKITATNKATGEIVELQADTLSDIIGAWRIAQEYEKTAIALKDQLKKIVPSIIGPNGQSEPIGSYQFRQSSIQRMTYDKATMREVLDPDVFDVLLRPDKPAVDKYLKENLETLGEASTALRQSMIAEGQPYTTIRLEKISNEVK